MSGLSIGKLAKAARVSIDTIRFYEKSGLLPPAARRPSGFREYAPGDLRQLQFILRARRLGFSIEEVAELLALDSHATSHTFATWVERKLRVIDRKLIELEQWRRALTDYQRERSDDSNESRSLLDFLADETPDSASDRPRDLTRSFLRDSHDKV